VNLFLKFPREIGFPERRLVKTKEEFLKFINIYNGHKNLYTTVYAFREINNFRANYETAIIDKVFFDFDPPNALENLEKITNYALDNNIMFTNLFSGRGYHHFQFVEQDPRYKKDAMKNYVHYIEELLTINVDPAVIGDLGRLTRIPFTWNLKGERYCIPISLEDIKKGHEFIKMKAVNKKNKPFYFYGEKRLNLSPWDYAIQHEKIELNGTREISGTLEELFAKANFQPGLCIKNFLSDPNLGNLKRLHLITALKEGGFSSKNVKNILKQCLSQRKYLHSVREERQVDNIFDKDYCGKGCSHFMKMGWCVKGCKKTHPVYV